MGCGGGVCQCQHSLSRSVRVRVGARARVTGRIACSAVNIIVRTGLDREIFAIRTGSIGVRVRVELSFRVGKPYVFQVE